MVNDSCIDPDTAAAFAARALSAEDSAAVEHHIDTCSDCRELVSLVVKTAWSRSSTDQSRSTNSLSLDDEAAVLRPGTRVGPYEIETPLDAGGMGVVYSAHDTRLSRRVALKCVRDRRADPKQLLREAQVMAQLAHPNLVPVYDVVEAFDQVFLAMELVVGQSLRQWVEAKPRRWQAVVDVFLEAGAGVAALHAAGITHGDVKPANILVGDDGRVRVTDFGLASFSTDELRVSSSASPRGTPAYLAPEQRLGRRCDERADQFSFCVSLYEALWGTIPGRPPKRAVRVPRGVQRALGRGMSADPAARYPSMTALLDALRASRSSRARWAAAAISVTVLATVASYTVGGRRAEAQQCAAVASQLEVPWNAEHRDRVRKAFEKTGLSYAGEALTRVDANLDAWAAKFDATRHRACEPGWFQREVPLERLGAQLACLTQSAREARALLNELTEADATVVRNAVAASEQLTPLERCTEPRAAPMVAPSGANVDAFRDALARARASLAAGKFKEALPLAQAAMQQAEALGNQATLVAPALAQLALAQARTADYEAAEKGALEAIRLAEQVQDDFTSATAWAGLVSTEYWRGEHARVVFLKPLALGATARAADAWAETEVLLMVGGSLTQLGRAAEAEPLFEAAAQRRLKLYGEKDRRTAFALSSLGNGLSMKGDLAGGIEAHRRAVEAAEYGLGKPHPNVGILHNNLGDDYLYGLELDRAVTEFDTGISILEHANGGGLNRDLAIALTDLGLTHLEAGRFEQALPLFDRADSFWSTAMPKHPARAETLFGRYVALAALGRAPSLAELETAVANSAGLPPFEAGRIQCALGMALYDAQPKGDPKQVARAKELITQGLKGLRTTELPLIQREVSKVERWLKAHPGR